MLLFVKPASPVYFSFNQSWAFPGLLKKTATSNQPTVFLSQQISTGHHPPAKRTGFV
jgi:hypothetical protein